MFGLIAIQTEKVTRYIPANADMEIYEYIRSLGYEHMIAAEVSSWASVANIGEIYPLEQNVFCEIRSIEEKEE